MRQLLKIFIQIIPDRGYIYIYNAPDLLAVSGFVDACATDNTPTWNAATNNDET